MHLVAVETTEFPRGINEELSIYLSIYMTTVQLKQFNLSQREDIA